MRKLLIGLVAAASLFGGPARAADHRDGPAVQADPTTDINDVYAWMSSDGNTVNLVMTVNPGATAGTKFSDAALYVFHINAAKAYPDPAPNALTVICRFDAAQKVSCWGPSGSGEYLTGDAGTTAGASSSTSKMKAFAGLRADPFFFNISGFRSGIGMAGAALQQAPGACPAALQAAGPQVAMVLASNGMGGAGKDGFAKGGDAVPNYTGNVMALVVSIDKTLLTDATHTVLGVWGSTNKVK